ncbi:MAG: glycoside hydrolase family 15 protein [Candidatus Parvarchaeum sp.]
MALTFADFKDIGFISNQLTGSLIDKNGNVLWLCFPRFDSDPYIAYLLDENKGGVFRINPAEPFSSMQKYTAPNVLRTTFKTSHGSADITDFLIPGKTILIRDLTSEIKMQLTFSPLFSFHIANFNYSENDGKIIFDSKNGKGRLVLEIIGEYKKIGDSMWELEKGLHQILLSYYQSAEIYELEDKNISSQNLSKALDSTIDYWGAYTERIKLSLVGTKLEEFEPLLRTSVFTILGLTYSTTGSIIAAPTASLPEDPGGNRNWDYRYVWVRDSAIMASVLCSLGLYIEGRRALEFLFNMIDYSGKPLYNLYKVDGTKIYGERYITSLDGFMGSKPVRIGNRATNQIQLDIEGEFLYAVKTYFAVTEDKEFIQNHIKAIEYIADWLADNWELADSGIWEKPDDYEYSHSKVMIWAALDSAGKLIKEVGGVNRWEDTKNEIKRWVLSNCVKDNCIVTFPGSHEVEAQVLSFPLYGFMDVNDPLFVNTLKIIEKTLVVKGFVYRYNFDSLGKASHSFVLCSAWLASIYAKLGRNNDAIRILENIKSITGPNNLIGEDIDVHNKTFTGNFPQGFVHASFIQALLDILKNS